MKFVCEDQTFSILEAASVTLGVVYPKLKKFVELEDTRLITIAQSLVLAEYLAKVRYDWTYIKPNPDEALRAFNTMLRQSGLELMESVSVETE